MKNLIFVCSVASLLSLSGCIQHIAVSTVGSIVDDGFDAFTEEQDLDFAAQALPSNLKLLEVMHKNEPDNVRLLRLLAEGYNSYALGFVEDTDPERAKIFYQRAIDYAMQLVRQDEPLAKALDGTVDELRTELKKHGKDDVPAIFWTAFGMGSYLNIALNEPDAIAMLPKAEEMMKFVAATDSSFYNAGADVFLGTLSGIRPKMFGGDPEASKRHFERALRINKGKFLMTHVYYARCAIQNQDETLFDSLLTTVDQTPLDVLPKFRLANAIAKKKAKILEAKKSDWF